MDTINMYFDKSLVEKFLDGTATQQEAQKVLNWLETKEGQEYLDSRFNKDVDQIEDLEEDFEDSQEAFHTLERIKARIDDRNSGKFKRFYHSPVWAIAAGIIFLIAVASVLELFYKSELYSSGETTSVTVYSTTADEQKRLRLSDGTVIRLNEHSRVEVPQEFNPESRAVKLEGEAFFEVTSDSLRPFFVEAGEAEIRVLGTAFSVKTASGSSQTIVAVSEGKVSLASLTGLPGEHKILEKNMLGLLNAKTRQVTKEDMDIQNYLSWMHGRVVFHQTPFSKVVRQLQHIYGISSELQDKELLDLRLTADFSERTLDNVLETIAHSLKIEVERDGKAVRWSLKKRQIK